MKICGSFSVMKIYCSFSNQNIVFFFSNENSGAEYDFDEKDIDKVNLSKRAIWGKKKKPEYNFTDTFQMLGTLIYIISNCN